LAEKMMVYSRSLNLKAAVGREKAVQAIDVHRKFINCVVTFWVMSQLLHFLGASRVVQTFVIQLPFLGLYIMMRRGEFRTDRISLN